MRPRRLVFWTWLNHWPWKRRGSTGEDWTRNRFDLWQRTALASIQAQTVTDWKYVLICSTAQQQLTRSFRSRITDKRVTLVHGGEERRWRARLSPAALYVAARLDSDDLYHPNAGVLLLRHARKKGQSLQFNQGYAWDEAEAKLYSWTQSSSPFYAQVTRGADYRRAPKVERPHHTAAAFRRATKLAPGHFVVTLHDANTSTSLRSGPLGPEITGSVRDRVVTAFGLGVS